MINVPTLASLRRAQSGFTLIEVLVASFVLMVGVVSALALLDRRQRRDDPRHAPRTTRPTSPAS